MDTGSSATTITPDAVNDFDLTTTRVTEQGAGRGNQLFVSASGLGGDGRYQIVEIPSLTIGGMRAQDVEAPVIPLFRDGLRSFPAYGLVGQDFLAQWDLDLDVAHDRLVLYRPQNCADVSPPWNSHTQPISLRPDLNGGKLIFSATFDGRELSGVLDTGAGGNVVQQAALGLDPAILAKDRRVRGMGIALQPFEARLHRFDHLVIDGVDEGPIEAGVGDTALSDYDFLLGEDFLRHHRVFIAFRAHKLFIADTK